jgi:hypothetical protein
VRGAGDADQRGDQEDEGQNAAHWDLIVSGAPRSGRSFELNPDSVGNVIGIG